MREQLEDPTMHWDCPVQNGAALWPRSNCCQPQNLLSQEANGDLSDLVGYISWLHLVTMSQVMNDHHFQSAAASLWASHWWLNPPGGQSGRIDKCVHFLNNSVWDQERGRILSALFPQVVWFEHQSKMWHLKRGPESEVAEQKSNSFDSKKKHFVTKLTPCQKYDVISMWTT